MDVASFGVVFRDVYPGESVLRDGAPHNIV